MKPHVKCMKICVNLNEDLHVKACVKPHVKCMWKYVWKGWHRFTPFSHIFHYAKFHMHVKYVCEMHVKSVWKVCEERVKIGIFSHVFHMVFHIHTPSSNVRRLMCQMSDERCLTTDVWYHDRGLMVDVWWQMSDNRHLMSDAWWRTSDNRRLMTEVWCQTSNVWWQMSDNRHLMTDVCCQTSDVLCVMTSLMSDDWCLMSQDRRLMSDVWWQMSDNRRLMSYVWWQMSDVRCLMTDVW